jgi:branched-chain amino acid transport system ATP-binding protein
LALLETQDVVMQFGGITAVDHASLTVEAGRVQGLIGPNGAGKTTTFNIVSGLQEPTAGRVLLDDVDISRKSVHERARMGVARTFQRLEVFGSLSVRDNIRTAIEIHRSWSGIKDRTVREQVEELIDLVGIRTFADERADAIPTGVARLTELGRALAIRPRLLLLDEPSSGLNEEETEEFGELLLRLAATGMAILMVEHDVDLVMRVCSWIDVLDFGRVIASGTAAEIRNDPTVQAAYLGHVDDEPLEVAG